MLKSPSPARASLVRHSLYKLNRIGHKQHHRMYELKNLRGETAFKSSIYVYLTEYFDDFFFSYNDLVNISDYSVMKENFYVYDLIVVMMMMMMMIIIICRVCKVLIWSISTGVLLNSGFLQSTSFLVLLCISVFIQ